MKSKRSFVLVYLKKFFTSNMTMDKVMDLRAVSSRDYCCHEKSNLGLASLNTHKVRVICLAFCLSSLLTFEIHYDCRVCKFT